MSFKRGLLDNIIRKWNKKLRYRSMAWLLIVCLCVVNLNSLAFAVEDGTQASGGATPSAASASEVMMPEEAAYGNELLEEAERAITNGAKFDFDSVIRLSETGDEDEDSNLELYKNLFDGYESFTLFYDNDHDGKIIGSRNDVYGYIVVRLTKKEYLDYLEMASPSETSESDTDENGGYHLSGNEDLIFLYVNGSDVDATFNINLADMETSEIVIPSLYSFDEEETEDIALTEEIVEEINVDNSAAPGAGGSGSSGVASDDNSTEETVNGEPENNQEESEEKTENDTEQEAGEETTEEEIKDSEIEDTNQNDESEEINTSDDNQSSGDEAENENSDAEEKSEENDSEGNADSNQKEVVDSDNNESEKEEKTSEEKADSDNQTDNDTEKGSDREDKSEDASSDSFKETEVTIIGKTVPRVMGPNPDATGEEDDDDMSFEEWQEMMEELEEEEETDEEDEYESSSYEEEDGTRYLNLSLLPVVTASVKLQQATQTRALFRMARSVVQEEPVALGASVVPTSAVTDNSVSSYYKQIEAKEDGNYRLHLGVSGKNPALDVLLVIDNSGSMYPDWDQKTGLMDELKETLTGAGSQKKGFIEDVFERSPDSRFAIIKYGTTASNILEWNSNVEIIEKKINELNYEVLNANTNYEDALYESKELLAKRTGNNIPVVIFMSDGVPKLCNRGNYYEDIIFNSSKDGTSSHYVSKETINAAKEFNKDQSVVGSIVYSVKFGNATDSYLRYVAYGEKTDSITDFPRVVSGDSLDAAFETLFTNLEFKNVQIEDTLSQYVDLTGTTLEESNVEVCKIVDGVKTILNKGTDYESLEYDSSSKKVSLKFGSDKVLDTNAVYELAFDIKASQVATEYYEANNSFPHTGEKNTDYGNGTISSGQPGFFSNEEAKLKFGTDNEVILPKPVVKVKEKAYELPHRKYIQDNKDGTYTLTLNVTSGVEGSSAESVIYPADVVFILDRSKSMYDDVVGHAEYVWKNGNWYWDTSEVDFDNLRTDLVNEAVSGLITQFSIYPDLYYNAFKFSDNNSNPIGWGHDYNSAIELSTSECDGGTNLNNAIEYGIGLVNEGSNRNSGKDGVKKHIILLTDGEPDGYPGYDSADISKLDSSVKVHLVSFANSTHTYLTGLSKKINDKNPDTAKVYSATSEEELQSVFDAIKASIEDSIGVDTVGVTNVVITDELSDYADFVSVDVSDVIIKMGTDPISDEEKEKAIQSIEIDEETKKITVIFNPEYELKKNVTYSISFDVKPTDKAYKDYENAGYRYPDIGDDGTDAKDNTSSSGQRGFHSNDKAIVTYTSNGIEGSQEYAHPVIQVLPNLVISKEISGIPEGEDKAGEFEFEVSFMNEDNTTFMFKECPDEASVDTNGVYTIKLNSTNKYAFTFKKLPKDVTYTVKETKATLTGPNSADYVLKKIEAYCDSAEPAKKDSTLDENKKIKRPELPVSVEASIQETGSNVRFVNTYASYGKITIAKELGGGSASAHAGDEFEFNITPGNNSVGIYESTKKVKAGRSESIYVEPEDVDVSFTVKESANNGAWKTEVNGVENGVGSVAAGETITFKNYYYKHDIVLKKKIEGDDKIPDADYKFNVRLKMADSSEKLSANDIILISTSNAVPELVDFKKLNNSDYQYEFSVNLQANGLVTISALPKSVIGYEIVEDIENSTIPANSEYEAILDSVSKQVGPEDPVSCTDNKAVGSFADATTSDQSDTVVFTNKFVKKTVKLTIEKHLVKSKVESDKEGDQAIAKEPLSFTFAIKDNSTKAVYYAVATVEKDQSSGTVEVEVPIGNYTITERKHLKYTAVKGEKDVVVTLNGDNKADFYNYQPSDKYFSDTNVKVNKVTSDGFQKTDPETDKTSTFSLRSILPFAYREEDKEEE